MPDIILRFNVEDVDSTLVDPHEIGDKILDTYEEWRRSNPQDGPEVATFHFGAEWE